MRRYPILVLAAVGLLLPWPGGSALMAVGPSPGPPSSVHTNEAIRLAPGAPGAAPDTGATVARPAVTIPLYPLDFAAPARVRGSSWTVNVDNESLSTTQSTLSVWLPNGTYAYKVTPPAGWSDPSPDGNVTIAGVPTNLLANLTGMPPSLGLLADPANAELYVSNLSGSVLDVDNRTSGARLASLPVKEAVFAPILSPAGDFVYVVSNNNGTVTVIDPSTNRVINTFVTGQAPQAGALDPVASILFVPNFASDNVTEIGAENDTEFGSIPTDSGPAVAVSLPDRAQLLVGTQSTYYPGNLVLDLFDLGNGTLAKQVTIGAGFPSGGVYDPALGEVFLAWGRYLIAFNVSTYLGDDTIILPSGDSVGAPVLDPLNGMIYVGLQGSGGLTIVNPVSRDYLGTVPLTESPFAPAFDPTNGGIWAVDHSTGGDASEINGTPTTVSVPLVPPPQTFTLTFQEGGLPTGTPWSVVLGNVTYPASSSSVSISELNGSHAFVLGLVPGFAGTPARGSAVIDGQPLSISITFAPVLYAVTFIAEGLPGGTAWSVEFNGTVYEAPGGSLAVSVRNGSYGYSIPAIPGYRASPPSTSVTVSGQNLSIAVPFSGVIIDYVLSFSETGLAAGTVWFVICNGTYGSSATDTITFSLPNGTYPYQLVSVPGYRVFDNFDNVTIFGSNEAIAAHYLPPLPAVYDVLFTESGLPPSASWRVEFNGTWSRTTPATNGPIVFSAINGSYEFQIGPFVGYDATPAEGTLVVAGGNSSRTISYTPVENGSNGTGPGFSLLGLSSAGSIVVLVGVVGAVLLVVVVVVRSRRSPPTAGGHEPSPE
jgi:YVTN family beta-propeller protein